MLIGLTGIVVISFTIETFRLVSFRNSAYLKTIQRPVIFEGEDVVRDGEDVSVGRNQTPEVDGFSWGHEKEEPEA